MDYENCIFFLPVNISSVVCWLPWLCNILPCLDKVIIIPLYRMTTNIGVANIWRLARI